MKITVEATSDVIRIEGQDYRIWRGVDDEGVPVEAMIKAVSPQTHDEDVNRRFEEQLQALPPLKRAGMIIDHRFID